MKVKDLDTTSYLALFEDRLVQLLDGGKTPLDDGMRYATYDGGKRIRPVCVYLGARAYGGDVDVNQIVDLAIGVELVHSYSLVHDDLPAMDNSEFRRGKLSTFKKFGHANGILVGDQLLTTAMYLLLQGSAEYGKHFADASKEIAFGAREMAYGQCADIAGCESVDEYLDMYRQKTGAMIVSSMRAGAICAGAKDLHDITKYAACIGLGFQLADDLLEDDDEPSILIPLGRVKTRELLVSQTKAACESARNLECAEQLISFANMLLNRTK